MTLFDIAFWMAAGASFYHFCPKIAKAIWGYMKSAYNYIKSRVSGL